MSTNPTRRDHPTVPLWMRRSTVVVVVLLSAGLFGLIAYYLLPMWWAQLVNVWVRSAGTVITGLLVGFLPIIVSLLAFRGALAFSPPEPDGSEDDEQAWPGKARHGLRLTLGVIAGLGLTVVILTVAIAIGFTEPLRQAGALWKENAPGVLVASLVGALVATIVVIGAYAVRLKMQNRRDLAAQPVTKPHPEEPDAESEHPQPGSGHPQPGSEHPQPVLEPDAEDRAQGS